MRIPNEVSEAIESELCYQEAKFPGHEHTVGEWLLIMEKCLTDAKIAWLKGDFEALHEIRQVTATGVSAMHQCGAPLRAAKARMRALKKPSQ